MKFSFNDDGSINSNSNAFAIVYYTNIERNSYKVIYNDELITNFCKLCYLVGMPYYIVTPYFEYFVKNNSIIKVYPRENGFQVRNEIRLHYTDDILNMFNLMDII